MERAIVALPADSLGDDSTLVRAVQAGDNAAYAELYRRHYPSVKRTCVRRLGDLTEADEIAQAAFVRAFERIDRCEGDRRFGAWVQVIAHRLCIDAIRARARTSPDAEPLGEETTPGHESPEESLLRGERVDHLNRALAMLPARQREVVIARHVDERGPGEIAASLGLTVGAVDSLLLRGRRRLGMEYRLVVRGGRSATGASGATGAAPAARPAHNPALTGVARPGLGRSVHAAATAAQKVTEAMASMPRAPGGGRALAVVAVAAASALGAGGGSAPATSSPRADGRPPLAAPARQRPVRPSPTHALSPSRPATAGAATTIAAPVVTVDGVEPVVGTTMNGLAPAVSGVVGLLHGPPAPATPGQDGTGTAGATGGPAGTGGTGATGGTGGGSDPQGTQPGLGLLPPISTGPVVGTVIGTVDAATSTVGQVAGTVTSPLQSVVTIPPLDSIVP